MRVHIYSLTKLVSASLVTNMHIEFVCAQMVLSNDIYLELH